MSGAKIVDGNGNEILLKGVGLGGWLVPEGYMLQMAGFANSPTEIKNKIIALVGQSNADQFFQSYRQNYVTRDDIDSIERWGFNSIRLPMHYNLLTPKGQIGVYLDSGFAYIDSLLDRCETNQIYLILDLHCAPGGQNSASISDYIGYPSLWEDTLNQQQTVALWKEIARRYANKHWIGGYDLLNETVWDLGPKINRCEIYISQSQMLLGLWIKIISSLSREISGRTILPDLLRLGIRIWCIVFINIGTRQIKPLSIGCLAFGARIMYRFGAGKQVKIPINGLQIA